MSGISTGAEIGSAVCDALGIDKNTIHTVRLDLAVGEVAELTTIGYVQRFDVSEVMRHYAVVKRAGWPPPLAPPQLGDVYYKATP